MSWYNIDLVYLGYKNSEAQVMWFNFQRCFRLMRPRNGGCLSEVMGELVMQKLEARGSDEDNVRE
jgi:hypothetical protein